MRNIQLAVERVSLKFGFTVALDNVSFTCTGGMVQAVVGHNGAGKSSLVKVLTGQVQPDAGAIVLNHRALDRLTPADAVRSGIGVVNQETALCPHLTVLQSLFLGREQRRFGRFGLLDWRSMARKGEALLRELDLVHLKGERISDLDVMHRQLVEVARALLLDPDILVLDEPNSAMGRKEADALFARIHGLRERGHLILYISHRLQEVKDIADTILVLRNGRVVTSVSPDVPTAELARLIIGQDSVVQDSESFKTSYPDARLVPDSSQQDLLRTENWTSTSGSFQNISLRLRSGEIVGITGREGAGHRPFLRSLFGLHAAQGQYILGNKGASARNPAHFLARGVAYLSPDRNVESLLHGRSVEENIGASAGRLWSSLGMQRRDRLRNLARPLIRACHIQGVPGQPVATLSGGNQQKTALARLLAVRPSILLLEEPTRGVDVGAKREIYGILKQLTTTGAGILIASPEFDELVAICDRVVVMRDGVVIGELEKRRLTEDVLLGLSMS